MVAKIIIVVLTAALMGILFSFIEHSYHEQKKKNKLREVKRWPLD